MTAGDRGPEIKLTDEQCVRVAALLTHSAPEPASALDRTITRERTRSRPSGDQGSSGSTSRARARKSTR